MRKKFLSSAFNRECGVKTKRRFAGGIHKHNCCWQVLLVHLSFFVLPKRCEHETLSSILARKVQM